MGLNNGPLESGLIMQELLKECRFLDQTLECLSLDPWGRDFLPQKDLEIARERVKEIKNERS